jgi:4-hydroxybenzoate polyprenyltransferase
MLPYVLMLVLAGYGWAHWDRAMAAIHPQGLAAVLLGWTLLHAGTLHLNAVLDRDEGEVLMGRSVPPPPGTAALGYLELLGCVALSALAGPFTAFAAAGCAVLAVLYSHPATMWKGHPLGGPFVNLVGYGLLSPAAGFAVTGLPLDPRTLAVWPLVGLGILGTYFVAQAFQRDEDAARGYRTLVVTHGPRVVLQAARVCMALAVGGGLTLAAIGWLPRGCLVVAPAAWAVDRWLVRWQEQPDGGDASWALGFTHRLLLASLLGLIAATVHYVHDSLRNEPVAGLGTAAGHPPDRPRLPPREMRLWEAGATDRRGKVD